MATYAPNQLHAVPLAELQPDPMTRTSDRKTSPLKKKKMLAFKQK